jgi:hypothetical protein
MSAFVGQGGGMLWQLLVTVFALRIILSVAYTVA